MHQIAGLLIVGGGVPLIFRGVRDHPTWVWVALGGVGLGVLLHGLGLLTSKLCPAVLFDADAREIRVRERGAGTRTLGRFDDFKGVELEARVRSSAPAGGALHEVHKTYPDAGLMTYALVLVGSEAPVPIVEMPAKPKARELQEQIVRHCGFAYSGTVVPDANRELPR